ncbi:MAG TPA: rod shape-determining protein [Candidatus Pacearchaeota archaeon]|nr:rod shape-determining protein [Candidatus Parcubacteria bacterium]HNZ84078.1 rod shape-determining protein [Candidatus Pacearchaeota archaeon]HOU45862.1 rod shape-determining protein [Candidatus Pacearchaeota archaeon]HPM08351.1 rod shape-determining protein [Candidatus Pacearchaeota archaeon]HQI74349.1 rod shape-determining protein [Candidatus Pacearchaeota archaeon]
MINLKNLKIKIPTFFKDLSRDLAIDLGTANSLVYVKGQGIVIAEPSVVALNQKTGKILAVGKEAEVMVGRTPSHIVATYPLVDGVVSDFEATEQMIKYFIEKVFADKFLLSPKIRVIIGVPCGITEVEKKAVIDAAKSAGAFDVCLIEEPMAAAIGARLSVQDAGGNFVVDIGGGTCEIVVISLGGIVLSKSLKNAGNKFDNDIINYCQEEYKLLIGKRTAEKAKIAIGSVLDIPKKDRNPIDKHEIPVRGRNLITGLPEEIILSEDDVRKAMEKSVRNIVEAIKETIEQTPPELLSDIMTRGIYLAGGGALLRGLDTLINRETKIPVRIVEDPLTAVVRGAGIVLEDIDSLKDVLLDTKELEPPR